MPRLNALRAALLNDLDLLFAFDAAFRITFGTLIFLLNDFDLLLTLAAAALNDFLALCVNDFDLLLALAAAALTLCVNDLDLPLPLLFDFDLLLETPLRMALEVLLTPFLTA